MKLKMFGSIIFAIFLGYVFGKVIFNQYNKNLLDVFIEKTPVFFLQQGVYSSVESLEENTKNLKNYVYVNDNNYYRVYVAITRDSENINKLKEMFVKKGNDIYVKELEVSNKEFINILEQYDKLIKLTTDEASVDNIIKETLIKYQELVVNGKIID